MATLPSSDDLAEPFAALAAFATTGMLTGRISDLERSLAGRTRDEATAALNAQAVSPALLEAALNVKRMAGQINVVVHAVGILVSLPHALEPGERILSLSLGAGNTGRLSQTGAVVEARQVLSGGRLGDFELLGRRGDGAVGDIGTEDLKLATGRPGAHGVAAHALSFASRASSRPAPGVRLTSIKGGRGRT